MKDFVNRVYSRLNPVITNCVDYYASLGQYVLKDKAEVEVIENYG